MSLSRLAQGPGLSWTLASSFPPPPLGKASGGVQCSKFVGVEGLRLQGLGLRASRVFWALGFWRGGSASRRLVEYPPDLRHFSKLDKKGPMQKKPE